MKKLLCLVIVCIALAALERPAQAAYITGADLARNCQSHKPEEIYSCLNYIAGVIDYHVMMQSLGTAPTTDFCLPETLPIQKAAVAVLDYLERSPQHNSFIAAPAIVLALHENFPCAPPVSKKRKKK